MGPTVLTVDLGKVSRKCWVCKSLHQSIIIISFLQQTKVDTGVLSLDEQSLHFFPEQSACKEIF